jgi:pimeloyl-ACP methyl ester carboxylesterase
MFSDNRPPGAEAATRTGTYEHVQVKGVDINLQDTGGAGPAVLLLHGWPDSHELWRHQVAGLTDAGYRVVAPDLRGFGDSGKPAAVEDYGLPQIIGDLVGVLDHLELGQVHVVGHDWGGAIGSVFAAMMPARVASLTCLSVGHPAAFRAAGWEQREKSWYMLLFQFAGVAERWLSQDDFRNFRELSRHPDADSVIARLREPAALTASLGVYRAVLAPESLVSPPTQIPPIPVPTMGVWSTGDFALTEQAMTGTAAYVTGPWRYERIAGAGHWMQLDMPDRVTRLLLDFLADARSTTTASTSTGQRPERPGGRPHGAMTAPAEAPVITHDAG